MTTLPFGPVTGTLPAPGAQALQGKYVHCILLNPDPAATTIVYFNQGAVKIKGFNVPPATGACDHPFALCGSADDDSALDPTLYNLTGGNAIVTYILL
jgi:hypothetical protein